MGISGLLPLLKSIHKPCRLDKFAGQTLGVDAYGWLHRGTVACAADLALGKPTSKYVDFAMSRVRMLIHFGIKPYLVFDGDYLPSKALTEKGRSIRRNEAKENGLRMLKNGKTADAYLELQKAVDVTPEMARLLIEELKKARVDYVVAPYEADSQLAYLERKKIINGIISEDSDLLVFGAQVLITKLDQYGECVMIRRDDFTACRAVSLVGWSDVEFRRMAILSGCDYLENISKMGLKTAHRLIRKHKDIDRLVRALQFDGQYKVPKDYLKDFIQAERTFLHQWVYCPQAKTLLNCTPIPTGLNPHDLPYIGPYVEPDIASAVAKGYLNPHTKLPMKLLPTPARSNSFYRGKENTTPAQTPDVKKNKDIQTFFKPSRTPLAELDPNILPLTPSQQQVLERSRHSGSWSAVAAPALPSPSAPHARASRSSMPARISRSFSSPLSASSASNPPKRRRILCEDEASDIPPLTHPSGSQERSKFFPSNKRSRPDPLLRSPKASKEGNLWSDDSIEEALSQLPEPPIVTEDLEFSLLGSRKTPRNRISIFDDTTQSTPAVESQCSALSCSTVATSEKDTQATEAPTDCDTQATSVSTDGVVEKAMSKPPTSTTKRSFPPSFVSRFSYDEDSSHPIRSPMMDSVPDHTEESSFVYGDQPRTDDDSTWKASNDTIVVATSPCRTEIYKHTTVASSSHLEKPQGSEDLFLVPNSEDESAGLSEDDDGSGATPQAKFDVRGFVFTS